MGLDEEQWRTFASGAEQVAGAVRDRYGMRTVFHHHCAGYVETPQEVAKLMELTDPGLLGLCLDMGHYAFGGGDPVEALERYYSIIDDIPAFVAAARRPQPLFGVAIAGRDVKVVDPALDGLGDQFTGFLDA